MLNLSSSASLLRKTACSTEEKKAGKEKGEANAYYSTGKFEKILKEWQAQLSAPANGKVKAGCRFVEKSFKKKKTSLREGFLTAFADSSSKKSGSTVKLFHSDSKQEPNLAGDQLGSLKKDSSEKILQSRSSKRAKGEKRFQFDDPAFLIQQATQLQEKGLSPEDQQEKESSISRKKAQRIESDFPKEQKGEKIKPLSPSGDTSGKSGALMGEPSGQEKSLPNPEKASSFSLEERSLEEGKNTVVREMSLLDERESTREGLPFKSLAEALDQKLKGAGRDEIVKNIRMLVGKREEGEIRLLLKPATLGEVKIQINLAKNHITGKIFVENSDVRQVFLDNLTQLTTALEGGKHGSVSLDVTLGGGPADQTNQGFRWQGSSSEEDSAIGKLEDEYGRRMFVSVDGELAVDLVI